MNDQDKKARRAPFRCRFAMFREGILPGGDQGVAVLLAEFRHEVERLWKVEDDAAAFVEVLGDTVCRASPYPADADKVEAVRRMAEAATDMFGVQ